jgi:hypothetical protein
MKTIITEKYEVDGYLFDDKSLATKLDNLLHNTPNSKICPKCKGTHNIIVIENEFVSDSNGYIAGTQGVNKQRNCDACKNGIVTKIVTEKWV